MATSIRYLRWVSLLFSLMLLMACSLNTQENVILPTLAVLPSDTPLPALTPTVTATSIPTETPAPTISRIDLQRTRVFGDFDLATGVVLAYRAPHRSSGEILPTMPAGYMEDHLEEIAVATLGFEIIATEMMVPDAGVTRPGDWYSDKNRYYFTYTYRTDSLDYETTQKRVPELLCSLRDAGLDQQHVELRLGLYSASGEFQGGSYFCVSPETIQELDCSTPSRINVELLYLDDSCLERAQYP